jgi:hypothetical protein
MNKNSYDFLTDFINSGRYIELAETAHEAWLKTKIEQGWSYGRKRDDEKKRNPWIRPFNKLPDKVRGANVMSPYSVANYFRTKSENKSLVELKAEFEVILSGGDDEMLQDVGEYIHSHFMVNMISQGETTQSRADMVVYENLDEETKSWDTQIALDVIKVLVEEIEELLG